jgi:hypothetical protein
MQLSHSISFNRSFGLSPSRFNPVRRTSLIKPKSIPVLADIVIGVIAVSVIADVVQTLQKRHSKPPSIIFKDDSEDEDTL